MPRLGEPRSLVHFQFNCVDVGSSEMIQVTKPFELYLALTPTLPKAAVVAAANTVARWVAGEEGKIFLKEAPVF